MLLSLPVQQDPVFVPANQFLLYVTEECNLRCSYCFVDKQPRHMSLETGKRAVDYALQPEVSGQQEALALNFFGGEPFLRTQFLLELLPYIRQRAGNRFMVGVTTNGTLANFQVQRFIEEAQANLLISLDGDAASHRFRPKASGGDSWPHLKRNLSRLLSWAPGALVRTTYHPGSLNLLEKVLAVQELNPAWILLSAVVESDWSGSLEALREQSERLAHWFVAEFRAGRRAPLYSHWQWLLQHHLNLENPIRPAKACALGTQVLAFDTAGNILPCQRYLYRKHDRLGHVQTQVGFPAARSRYVHLSRAEIPDCADCIARVHCGGGCRVVAQEGGYGLTGVHPNHCLITREQARQVQFIYQQLRDHPGFLSTVLSQQQIPLMFQEAEPIF